MLTKHELLAPLAELRGDAVVVTAMAAVRPWWRLSPSPLNFASADSAMGHAADLALGLALACPDRKVICLNGDGSMLMTLGTLASISDAAPGNLVLFVLQNDTYEITGNQAVPGAGRLDFAAMARAAGILRTYSFDTANEYAAQLPEILQVTGPVVVAARVQAGDEGPVIRDPDDEVADIQPSLAESAHLLRKVLRG